MCCSLAHTFTPPLSTKSRQGHYLCFQNEDYQGNILTNNVGGRVITIIMQFNQLAFPIGYIGGNKVDAYDYYRLRSRITRRTINNN